MKQKIAILLPGMLLAVAVMAQSTRQQSQTESQGVKAPQSMPTVEQILDRHVQAIGGATAWDKLTSRITKITVEFEGSKVTGSFERYEQAPNRDVLIAQLRLEDETLQ